MGRKVFCVCLFLPPQAVVSKKERGRGRNEENCLKADSMTKPRTQCTVGWSDWLKKEQIGHSALASSAKLF